MIARLSKVGLVAAAAAAVCWSEPATADKTVLRVASSFPEQSVSVRGFLKPWLEQVRKEVGDQLDIKEFWGGSLGRASEKQLDLVVDGVADAVSLVPSYSAGRFAGFSIHELPQLTETGVEGSVAHWRLYQTGMISGFEDVKVIGICITSPYRVHTKNEIKSQADLKGLKIRTSGATQSVTMEQFGALPIGIPLNQATEALSRGLVDGVLLGYAALGNFRMESIARYHYEPALGSGPIVAVMNKQKWESLPDNVKKVMDKHGGEALALHCGKFFDDFDAKLHAKMRSDSEHKFIPTSAELKAKGRAAFQPVYDKWIAETKDGKKIFDTYGKIIADIRGGK